jgi:hypothetical protein
MSQSSNGLVGAVAVQYLVYQGILDRLMIVGRLAVPAPLTCLAGRVMQSPGAAIPAASGSRNLLDFGGLS